MTAQTNNAYSRKPYVVNFGPGFGFDYGGIGVNFMAYPQKNMDLFFEGGYTLAGFGYNTGVKFRLSPDPEPWSNPFFTAMYGYNAGVVIMDDSQLSKLFYGPTLGIGLDMRPRKPSSKGFLSLALMIPIRNSDARNYIDLLKNAMDASFANDLSPFGVSVGYKFILND